MDSIQPLPLFLLGAKAAEVAHQWLDGSIGRADCPAVITSQMGVSRAREPDWRLLGSFREKVAGSTRQVFERQPVLPVLPVHRIRAFDYIAIPGRGLQVLDIIHSAERPRFGERCTWCG